MYSDIPVGVNYIISWYPIVTTTDKQLVNKQLELPNSASPPIEKSPLAKEKQTPGAVWEMQIFQPSFHHSPICTVDLRVFSLKKSSSPISKCISIHTLW